MGIKRPSDRLPTNVKKLYQDMIGDVLPVVMPSFIPSIVESTLTITQNKPVGDYTLELPDAGNAICGGNGTIFIH